MRLIFQGFGRAWAVELTASKVIINPGGGELAGEPEDDETLRPDPRGTVYAQVERRTEMEDAYTWRSFGFGMPGSTQLAGKDLWQLSRERAPSPRKPP